MSQLKINITNINSPNPFKISYKSGDSVYPLSGYTYYNNGFIYSGGTTGVTLSGDFLFNTQYWIKIEDTVLKTVDSDGKTLIPRYIVENIYTGDPIKYKDCCSAPINVTVQIVDLDSPSPTPTTTPTPTPSMYISPSPTPTITPTPSPSPSSGSKLALFIYIPNS